MADFLFRGSLADLDADVDDLINIEGRTTKRKLILIPARAQPLRLCARRWGQFFKIFMQKAIRMMKPAG